jgi:hypothetical protein
MQMQIRTVSTYRGNIELSVETEWRAGSTTEPYGLLFRLSDGGGYLFGISAGGGFVAGRWDRGFGGLRDPVEVVSWTRSELIRQQGMNTLGIETNGPTVDLMINGTKVSEFSDNRHTEGVIGVFVESVQEIAFDDLGVQRIAGGLTTIGD